MPSIQLSIPFSACEMDLGSVFNYNNVSITDIGFVGWFVLAHEDGGYLGGKSADDLFLGVDETETESLQIGNALCLCEGRGHGMKLMKERSFE